VGPKQIEPHSYGSGKGCVNAGDLGLGSVSVQINALKDFGNTNYCVLGYENLECTGLMHVKHSINADNDNERKWKYCNEEVGHAALTLSTWILQV